MLRSHLAPVFVVGLVFVGCSGSSNKNNEVMTADASGDGGSGDGTGGTSTGGTPGTGGAADTGGAVGTGGAGTGGDMGGMGGGAGGDTGGAGGMSTVDGGAGNSTADCKAYCTCMATDCTAEEPKKCLATCMAATTWDLSCRSMACLDVKKNPKMKAADCQHAIGMMGMCTDTGGGMGGSGGGEDAGAPPSGDAAAGNTGAECKAYCGCMAADCAMQEPKNCVTTCMAAKNWDLSCRTMSCLDVKKTPAMKAMDCQYAIGMMGMCTNM
jgi:hypothetical protein